MYRSLTAISIAALAIGCGLPASAEDNAKDANFDVQTRSDEFARFAPRPSGDKTKIDYTVWDDALKYFVFRMGPSDRRGSTSVAPEIGSRIAYGHDSRFRLEGNRIGFSFLGKEQIDALTEYRQDLERTANIVDIASLSRNEQLAYWLNLHNVAVIEQIAKAYPVRQPSQIKIGQDKLPLDQAKIVTVAGVRLSPQDIRTKIVYPNWTDPRVMYGFFRGEIGGPTIHRRAFSTSNLNRLLNASAFDFVNSLRGLEKRGSTLHVSSIYDEAKPYYFSEAYEALPTHLRKYSNTKVRKLIDGTTMVKATIYEKDISDLAGGEKDPSYGFVSYNLDPKDWGFSHLDAPLSHPGVPRNISRLVEEKQEKYLRLIKAGVLRGEVIFLEETTEEEAEVP